MTKRGETAPPPYKKLRKNTSRNPKKKTYYTTCAATPKRLRKDAFFSPSFFTFASDIEPDKKIH